MDLNPGVPLLFSMREPSTVVYVFPDRVEAFETTGNLLNSALDEGAIQEYSCRVGQCSACVGRLIDASADEILEYLEDGDFSLVGDEFGYLEFDSPEESQDVVRHTSQTLSDEEIDMGFVYTCLAAPTGDGNDVVIDMGYYPPSIESEI